jgi:hypothetical protein
MKKSEKAQAHMKILNELLAERRRNATPVIHRCDICEYTFKTKVKLIRHNTSQRHKDNIKSTVPV